MIEELKLEAKTKVGAGFKKKNKSPDVIEEPNIK